MSNQRIERSSDHGRFTEKEIREFVAETKRKRAQPGFIEREEREKRAAAAKAKSRGVRFPELAKRCTTKPALSGTASTSAARARLLEKTTRN